jgi:nucleotide-binding universal stress UspA family protein
VNTLRRVLCATDLSVASRLAVERACRIAAQRGSALSILHVVDQGAIGHLRQRLGAQAAQTERRLVEQLRVELHEFVEACTSAAGVAADSRLSVGPVVDEILAQAVQLDAGLVVVGSRGAGLLRSLLPGATAGKLVRKAARPVLVVRTPATAAYRRLLVAVDFSDAALAALQAARQLAPAAELVLVNAFEVPFESRLRLAGLDEQAIRRYHGEARREALEQLAAFATRAGLEAGSVGVAALHGQPSRVIVERAAEGDIDLVVIGRHGRGVVEKLLLGSVAQNVLAEASRDVLIAGS